MNINQNTCLFDVYARGGGVAERIPGWLVTRKYGRDIWDLYTEAVDHSAYCEREECVQARKDAMAAWNLTFSDPFLTGDQSEPPF